MVSSTNPNNFFCTSCYCEYALCTKKSSDTQRLVRAIVVLIRNTTWRCGKLERLIVKNLYKRNVNFGGLGMPIKEMIQSFELNGKKRNEFLDAIRRLERRNIVKILI
jgi:hypothetical protein